MTPITPDRPAVLNSLDGGLSVPQELMGSSDGDVTVGRNWPQSVPFYYGWVNVVMAAIAMTATLPSRTHGLGLITVPLLNDLQISEPTFAWINFVSTMLGAAFCLPIGYLIDRYGVRLVLTVVSLLFGCVVLGMAAVTGPVLLLIALTLIRGFGQSALSIVSTAIVGKWFGGRMGVAMGVYAVLLSIGFIATIVAVEEVATTWVWRTAWNGCGLFLICGLAPLGWLLVRNTPEACGVPADASLKSSPTDSASTLNFTHQQALATPAFWVIALGTSMFNFVWSSITLLNQSVLLEQGFTPADTKYSLALLVPGGLVANVICGVITNRNNVARVLGWGMLLLSICLTIFPEISTSTQLRIYMLAMGVIGGIVTVAHFVAWRALFGASHLGRIQGPAQLLSVLFSASGPLFAASCHAVTGTYRVGFYVMAGTVGILAIAAFMVPIPKEIQCLDHHGTAT